MYDVFFPKGLAMKFNYLKLYACLTLSGLTIWLVDQAWTMYQLKLVSDATTKAFSQASQPKKIQIPLEQPSYKKPLTRKEREKEIEDARVCDFFIKEYRQKPTEENRLNMRKFCPIKSSN